MFRDVALLEALQVEETFGEPFGRRSVDVFERLVVNTVRVVLRTRWVLLDRY